MECEELGFLYTTLTDLRFIIGCSLMLSKGTCITRMVLVYHLHAVKDFKLEIRITSSIPISTPRVCLFFWHFPNT